MLLVWKGKLKVKIWLLEGWSLTTIERIMFPLLISLNLTRLTPQQIDERRAKGLCFNCDSKYSKGHKCCENKLFYIECEEEEDQELEPSQDLEQFYIVT
jgi:hypothetical protein